MGHITKNVSEADMMVKSMNKKSFKILLFWFYFPARAVREGFGGGKFHNKQGPVTGPSLRFDYHNYDDLTSYLRNVNSMFPNITALYSIGKSVQGTLHEHIQAIM